MTSAHSQLALLFGLVTALTTISAHAADPACTPELLIKDCKSLADKSLSLLPSDPPLQSGTVVFNPIAATSAKNRTALEKLAAPDERSKITAERIFDETRAAAKAYIVGDVAKSAWTEEQRAILSRLETVEVKVLPANHDFCQEDPVANFPTLWHFKQGHSILLCPAATKLHPAVLKRAIAHELGHVVSPCQLSRPIFTVDQKKLASKDFETCSKNNPGGRNAKQWREYFGQRTHTIPDNPTKENELKPLEECGVVKRESSMIKEPQLFSKIHACLAKAYNSAYENWIDGETSKQLDLEPGTPPGALRFEVAEKNPIKCLKEVDEHFADAFSSAVFASMMERAQLPAEKTESDVRASLTDWAAWMCHSRQPGADNRGYPSAATRFRVATSEPLIQAKLQCQDAGKSPACTLRGFSPHGDQTSSSQNQKTKASKRAKAVN